MGRMSRIVNLPSIMAAFTDIAVNLLSGLHLYLTEYQSSFVWSTVNERMPYWHTSCA